jgi:hypothetical protein
MNDSNTILLLGILAVVTIFTISMYRRQSNASEQEPPIVIVNQEPERPLPYWTAYGLPEYWPSYLSPYWYYDVPYYGPITGTSGYYPSRHQWSGGRANYMPHGWGGRQPIGGASGVAVGGGGGGGHGGGR